MNFLSWLTVAFVLFGLTTQASACNYERMSRIPNYAKLNTPRKVFNIPQAHGICVAPNGNFAVVSWNTAGKVYLYYSCGKLMKVVSLRNYRYSGDCAFTENNLYVTSSGDRKVYELSTNGKFIRVFASGQPFFHIAICQNRFYFTTGVGRQNFLIYDNSGKQIRSISVPGHARGVIVGMDDKVYVSNWDKKSVYSYTLDGKKIGVLTTKEVRIADGLAMDTAGNLLVTDHNTKVVVYSPCGEVVKTIQVAGSRQTSDVEIGNDGTVMVAAWRSSKVYLY